MSKPQFLNLRLMPHLVVGGVTHALSVIPCHFNGYRTVISKTSAPVKIRMYHLVGAGGRSPMLNPFTNNIQFKKNKKTGR